MEGIRRRPAQIALTEMGHEIDVAVSQSGLEMEAAAAISPGRDRLAQWALGGVDLPARGTWREIAYEERDGVGYLDFDFYNGAMSTDQCHRLLDAYRDAVRRPTRVIVLRGGRDFFSNGIHLNVIEAADDPAME